MKFPILFQLTHQPNLKLQSIRNYYVSSPVRTIIEVQNRFFQSLLREPITLSLRYVYEPTAASDQCLQIFLLFNTQIKGSLEQKQLEDRLSSALQISDFYQIYPFQRINLNSSQFQKLQNLDWVNYLVEIQKGETISDKGYYLPRPFSCNYDHNMVNLCEQFSRVRNVSPERFLLEITLEPYNNPSERSRWMNALDTLLKAQSKAANSAKDAILETVIKGVQDYHTNYSHNPLFTYSLKLLAEKEYNLSYLATTWVQNATSSDYTNQYPNLPVIRRGSLEFEKSLQATREVRVSPQSSYTSSTLQTWQQKFGHLDIYQVFRPKPPYYADGSTSFSQPTPPPQPPVQNAKTLPTLSNTPQTSSSLTWDGSHALAKPISTQGWQRPQPAQMQDLLPLRHLVTLDEFSSFLRVVVPDTQPISGMAVAQSSYPTMTAEELFDKYQHLITRDTYIVGLDDQGEPAISSWDEIPHRLIAGQTGFGKTNFIQWILFQFFYANPSAKVYAMDFKGIDFPDLQSFLPDLNLEVVTEFEEGLNLIDKIDMEERERASLINKHPGVKKISDLWENGISISRTLWIIDEAADIADATYDLAETIEKRLKKYARKGRSFGIHMIYAAQCPDSSVISTQVTDQLGEKTVFKVTAKASQNILEIEDAEHIDKKGRAILHRGISNWHYVNTPEMPNLSKRPPATTVWGNLPSSS
jgi:hypothetical protein